LETPEDDGPAIDSRKSRSSHPPIDTFDHARRKSCLGLNTECNSTKHQCHTNPSICNRDILAKQVTTRLLSSVKHTSRNHFTLSPPLAQDSEQESQRIRDGHRKTQLCVTSQPSVICLSMALPCPPLLSKLHLPFPPYIIPNLRKKTQKLTSLPNQQEEPHTPRYVQQEWNRVRRSPQQIHDRPE